MATNEAKRRWEVDDAGSDWGGEGGLWMSICSMPVLVVQCLKTAWEYVSMLHLEEVSSMEYQQEVSIHESIPGTFAMTLRPGDLHDDFLWCKHTMISRLAELVHDP